jgi:hypothetical protein
MPDDFVNESAEVWGDNLEILLSPAGLIIRKQSN